jgi:hypothetical protein
MTICSSNAPKRHIADYLITGNKRHFPSVWRSTKVVNAREFIEELASDFA